MTRDPVDRRQLDAGRDAAETAQESERNASTNQQRSYPAAVVHTMLSRGLGDLRVYADVVREYPYASREIFLLLNDAFGMAFAQRIMKLAQEPEPVAATSQASRPETAAVAATQRDRRHTRDVTTAESQETSCQVADDPAPDGANRVSFAVPAAGPDIDDVGRTCDLLDDTGVVTTSTSAVAQDPAVHAKVPTAAANRSVAGPTTTTLPAQSGHPHDSQRATAHGKPGRS
jgi:hypothetical protein